MAFSVRTLRQTLPSRVILSAQFGVAAAASALLPSIPSSSCCNRSSGARHVVPQTHGRRHHASTASRALSSSQPSKLVVEPKDGVNDVGSDIEDLHEYAMADQTFTRGSGSASDLSEPIDTTPGESSRLRTSRPNTVRPSAYSRQSDLPPTSPPGC